MPSPTIKKSPGQTSSRPASARGQTSSRSTGSTKSSKKAKRGKKKAGSPGSIIEETGEEEIDEEAEVASAAALLAEVMRPIRTPAPPADADYLKPSTTPEVAASTQTPPKKVALLTAGGLAPCLSSAVAALICEYTAKAPDVELICYTNGYQGLLLGESLPVTPELRTKAADLHLHGGSPIGNSRVKLTNVKDCVKRGLVKEGQDPQRVAADQLVKDGVDVLHTIGGDDTNTAAADLAAFLAKESYNLCVIGLPKTIDNDVFPITQSLGAWTAAEQGAKFFANVVAESTSNPRMLVVHEVMGFQPHSFLRPLPPTTLLPST